MQSHHVDCMGEGGPGAAGSAGVGCQAGRRGNTGNSGSDSDSGPPGAREDDGAADVDDDADAGQGGAIGQAVHYYVNVPHCEDSAYTASEMNVENNTQFPHHLQEHCGTTDISTFLVLPEIIPPRELRRQQPLLDFTKLKILTSHAYTESCERVLTQKQATQAEAKRKAQIREATKETRRQEKEEKQVQVRARKEARVAKNVEKERALVEKRAHTRRRRLTAPRTWESPPRSPQMADGQPGSDFPRPPPQGALGDSAPCGDPRLTGPPPSSPSTTLSNPPTPHVAWPKDPLQPSPSFWNNHMLPMRHMFQQPLPFSHNGNPPWVPHITMAGAGDVRARPPFQGVRLLGEELATSGSHRYGVGT